MSNITVTPLFSGSSGNCTYIRGGNTRILIDAGVSARRIRQGLGYVGCTDGDIDALFITHEHRDHIAALPVLMKKCSAPVHMTEESYLGSGLCLSVCTHETVYTVQVGELTVRSFPLSHDSACCVGYTVEYDGHRVGFMTDTGYVTDEAVCLLCGCEQVVIECNHDRVMLRNGAYPYYLKERIAGRRGHLSNMDCADFCAFLAGRGTRDFYLAHLSRENNEPDIAYSAVMSRLAGTGAKVHIAPEAII
ncbi:MAG: MBL fold metallo-hydrolase [Clostridia bacterium]|nr:MBL fold metallo-hydrolase [Clostridia bacterium]